MSTPTIVLAAADAGPCNNLRILSTLLESQGCTVICLFGNGDPLIISDDEIDAALTGADVVLLGLSSNKERADPELRLARAAHERGIPYGFYLNIPLERKRPWLGKTATHASFLVGVLPEDKEGEADLRAKFPEACFFNTGSPERGILAFPRYTREEARTLLNIKKGVNLVLAPGRKEWEGNLQVWGALVDAIEELGEQGKDFVLMLSQHPGEPNKKEIREQHYDPFVEGALRRGVRVEWLPEGRKTTDFIIGADIVAEFDGGASVIAAYLRVFLLKLTSETLFRVFAKEVLSDELETLVNGAGLPVKVGDSGLGEILLAAANPLSPLARGLRRMQERAYPLPAHPDVFTKSMAGAIRVIADRQ